MILFSLFFRLKNVKSMVVIGLDAAAAAAFDRRRRPNRALRFGGKSSPLNEKQISLCSICQAFSTANKLVQNKVIT